MKMIRKTYKGSALGFAFLLLSLLLVSGIAVVNVSNLERKSGFASQKSVIAFQAADSAAERVLYRIYVKDSPRVLLTPLNTPIVPDATLDTLANSLTSVSSPSCTGGTISGSNSPSTSPNYSFQVTFYDATGATIACSDTTWRDKLIRIHSEGFYQRTSRVIEIGVRTRNSVNP